MRQQIGVARRFREQVELEDSAQRLAGGYLKRRADRRRCAACMGDDLYGWGSRSGDHGLSAFSVPIRPIPTQETADALDGPSAGAIISCRFAHRVLKFNEEWRT